MEHDQDAPGLILGCVYFDIVAAHTVPSVPSFFSGQEGGGRVASSLPRMQLA